MDAIRSRSEDGVIVQSVVVGVTCDSVVGVGEVALRRIDDLQSVMWRDEAEPIVFGRPAILDEMSGGGIASNWISSQLLISNMPVVSDEHAVYVEEILSIVKQEVLHVL